jgi:hypothetical protein
MKTSLLGATAMLTIGIGSAFAEGGDGWDAAHMLDQGPVGFTMTQPQTAVRQLADGMIIAHSSTDTPAAMATVAPQAVAPQPTTSRVSVPASSYPVTWGGG